MRKKSSKKGGSTKARKATQKKKVHKARKTPRTRRPAGMSLEEWQIALRKEFGREQRFRLRNAGEEPVFSEFSVTNPETGKTYRVAIRGCLPGENHCSCPDYAVNTLGTCKHIEFTLARLERRGGGKKALAAGFQPKYSEVFLRYGARREVVFRPGMDIPVRLEAEHTRWFDKDGVLKPDGYAKFHLFLRALKKYRRHEVRCYQDALSFVAQVRDAEDLTKRVMESFANGRKGKVISGLLKTKLYPYQEKGAVFAAAAGRSVIADDMGLGKTVQAIAAAEILGRTAGIERVLVVTPASLKHQWRHEIGKFTRRSVEVVQGLHADRLAGYRTDTFFKITNYDVVHRDHEAIDAWAPDLIILDEAQRIKNWKTRTAKAVKGLSSEHAIVLTGTPMENRLEELHSIVEFVDRYRLGPLFRFLHQHQHLDEHGRVIGYHNLSSIAETLKPILMRRTKKEVLKELPARLEKRLFVPMTAEQMRHHEENGEIVARIVAKWRRLGYLSEQDQRRLMIALQNMRMSCNSTYLMDHETDRGVKCDELMNVLGDMFNRNGAKAVVFSQWLRTHELLVRRLKKKGWEHVLFHGGVPTPKRKDLIQRFRADHDCRVFLSTDAGGVGLNLQNASVVVNMDQPWNPAVLEQRAGRVHRLGQHRPVNVIHFISEGTIEHGMLDLLGFKKSMFEGVFDGGKDEVFLGGTRLKRFMESVEKTVDSIPEKEGVPRIPMADEKTEAKPPKSQDRQHESARPEDIQRTLEPLIAAGRAFLDGLEQSLGSVNASSDTSNRASSASAPTNLLERDPKTGRAYLKLPLPSEEVLGKIVGLLSGK